MLCLLVVTLRKLEKWFLVLYLRSFFILLILDSGWRWWFPFIYRLSSFLRWTSIRNYFWDHLQLLFGSFFVHQLNPTFSMVPFVLIYLSRQHWWQLSCSLCSDHPEIEKSRMYWKWTTVRNIQEIWLFVLQKLFKSICSMVSNDIHLVCFRTSLSNFWVWVISLALFTKALNI